MKHLMGLSKLVLLVISFISFTINLQSILPIPVNRSSIPPIIDGKLNDLIWTQSIHFNNFKSFQPDYGKNASEETTVYLSYDRENIYVAFKCFDKNPDKIKASITKRDNMFGDDWVAICLDTYNDHQSGYCFLVNPLGIQGDGMLNLEGNLDESHDMVWYSKGRLDEDGYTVEMKIPAKSIRFPNKHSIKMGAWFVRNINRASESVSYPGISPEGGGVLTQTQPILINDLKYKQIFEVLPAITHGSQKNFILEDSLEDFNRTDLSFTGKLGLTSNLMLDAAYNPDFSQVESDAGQVDINLRYGLFFQEKRPFFQEGSEMFGFAGNTESAPIYSIVHTRNIIDPSMGLKISGKLGAKTSISSIYAIDESPGSETNDDGILLHPGKQAIFSILRLRHAITGDSYIGGFVTNRDLSQNHNRVIGADGRFRLSSKSLSEFHLLGSITNDTEDPQTGSGHALGLRYNYSGRKFNLDLGYQDISNDFRIDSGFLTRTGISRFALFSMLSFYPKSKIFQKVEPFYWSYHIYDKESRMMETFNLFTFRVHMPRQSQFRLDAILANEIYEGQRFNRNGIGFQIRGQIFKQVFLSLFYRYGQLIYYDDEDPYQGQGNRVGFYVEYQPIEKLATSMDIIYSDFYRSPNLEKVYDYTIFRNRTTFQPNKYLLFRGILEYNLYHKRLLADLLASFTYIPGTVIHVGYGSIFEKPELEGLEPSISQPFEEIRRGFFLKISYLWRL